AHSFVDAIGGRLDEHDDVVRFEVFDMMREHAIFHVAEEEGVNPLQQIDSLLAGERLDLLEASGLQGLYHVVEYGPCVCGSYHLSAWNTERLAFVADLSDGHGELLRNQVSKRPCFQRDNSAYFMLPSFY